MLPKSATHPIVAALLNPFFNQISSLETAELESAEATAQSEA